MGGNPAQDASSNMPLAGVVLCCTSIGQEQRAALGAIATQMGAVHKLDLTSDVTHLVVGSIDTAKYKYVAKHRDDIKVLQPAWLKALRAKWISDEAIDVEQIEEEYRVPPFAGLRICLTNFDDVKERQELGRKAMNGGATYEGNLTKDITHLIAAKAGGAKYERAQQWGITIVAREWLDMSLQRRMSLDENLFSIHVAPKRRGQGAWVRETRDAQRTASKRPHEPDRETGGARKLRRTASARLGSQGQDMWNNLSKQGEAGAPHLRVSEGSWMETRSKDQRDLHLDSEAKAVREERQRATTMARQTSEPRLDRRPETVQGPQEDLGLFQGLLINICGFGERKSKVLDNLLTPNGAVVVHGSTDLTTQTSAAIKQGYVLVPQDSDLERILDAKRPQASSMTAVTEWWVEKCVLRKQLIDPASDVLSRPFYGKEVHGLAGLRICSTSFESVDLLHLSRAVVACGAVYEETCKTGIDVLVCNDGQCGSGNRKVRFAFENGIPVVSVRWLWHSIEKGSKQPLEKYNIQQQRQNTNAAVAQRASVSSPMQNPRQRSEGSNSARPPPKQTAGPFLAEEDTDSNPPAPMDENTLRGRHNHSSRRASSSHSSRQQSRRHTERAPLSPSADNTLNRQSASPGHISHGPAAHAASDPEKLKNDLADLVQRTSVGRSMTVSVSGDGSRPSSAAGATDVSEPRRRPRRPLGRVQSNASEGSFSRPALGAFANLGPQDATGDEVARFLPPDPSQVITYDEPEAAQRRDALLRKVAGGCAAALATTAATTVTVARADVARDVVDNIAGAGGRGPARAAKQKARAAVAATSAAATGVGSKTSPDAELLS